MQEMIDELFQLIQSVVRKRSAPSQGMKQVLDLCATHKPHEDWNRFGDIDYDLDVRCMASWIPETFVCSPCPFPIRGLWFGLGQFSDHDDNTWADLSVGALGQYDPSDKEAGWLFGKKRHYPDVACAHSRSLRRIYEIAYCDSAEDSPLGNDAEYPLCIAFAAFAMCQILPLESVRSLIRSKHVAGVAVGYDSGDFLRLGELTRDGFRINRKAMI